MDSPSWSHLPIFFTAKSILTDKPLINALIISSHNNCWRRKVDYLEKLTNSSKHPNDFISNEVIKPMRQCNSLNEHSHLSVLNKCQYKLEIPYVKWCVRRNVYMRVSKYVDESTIFF